MTRILLVLCILLASVGGWCLGARAQTDAETFQIETLRSELEGLRTLGDVRARAGDPFAIACPPLTYQDVLADPDNMGLSICYTRQAIEVGDLLAAQIALERLLLLDPGFVEARYLYALVLYREGNGPAADRVLAELQTQALSPEDARQVGALRDEIALGARSLRQTLTLSMGVHYDTNRNAAPRSESLLGLGTVIPITNSEDTAQADFGYLGVIDYGVSYDPGWDGGHRFVGSATLYVDEQARLDESDLVSGIVEGGMALNALGGVLTPQLAYGNVRLAGEHVLSTTGASLRYDRLLEAGDWFDAPVGAFAELGWADESYHNNNDTTTLVEQDGDRYRLEAGVVLPLARNQNLRLALGLVDKDAAANYRAYRGIEGSADYTLIIGSGQFVIGSLALARNDYDAADPLVSGVPGIVRRDDILRARATWGADLGSLFGLSAADGTLGQVLSGTTWTVTAEHLRQDSNIINYEYRNNRFQTLLSHSWQF